MRCAIPSRESCAMIFVMDEHNPINYLAITVQSLDLIFRNFRQHILFVIQPFNAEPLIKTSRSEPFKN
jgi:hypothetical protein